MGVVILNHDAHLEEVCSGIQQGSKDWRAVQCGDELQTHSGCWVPGPVLADSVHHCKNMTRYFTDDHNDKDIHSITAAKSCAGL